MPSPGKWTEMQEGLYVQVEDSCNQRNVYSNLYADVPFMEIDDAWCVFWFSQDRERPPLPEGIESRINLSNWEFKSQNARR